MGQEKNIKPWVKQYVSSRASHEPQTPRDELAKKLDGELRKLGHTPPAKTTMRKMISAARIKEPSPQDQPWQMGTLKHYPHSAEGIAAIMEAYRFAAKHNGTLTIRQAKWIERLREVPRQMFPEGPSEQELAILLIIWACQYAKQEIWSEVTQKPSFDTTNLDYQVAMRLVGPPDQWETMAAFLLEGSPLFAQTMKEWAKEPINKRSLDRRSNIDGIIKRMADNPELADDATLKAQLASLLDEEAHKLEREEQEPDDLDDLDRLMASVREQNPRLYRQICKAAKDGREDEFKRLLASFQDTESHKDKQSKGEGK